MYFGMKLQTTKYKKEKEKKNIPRQIVTNFLKTSDREKPKTHALY